LFGLLLDTVCLSVVVILLLVEMMCFLCSHFNWQFDERFLFCGNVSLNSYEFLHNFYSRVENDNWSAAQLLGEILRIRDDDCKCRVPFSDGRSLSTSALNCTLSLSRS